MNSTILRTASKALLPIFLLASLIILLRGHNEPGGGFIGGLMAVIAVALYAIAAGPDQARKALRFDALNIAGVGLLAATVAGLWGQAVHGAFLQGVWPYYGPNEAGKLEGLPVGSILLFDAGVYLTVLGAVSAIIFALEDAVYHADDGDKPGETE
ncbi:MAG: multicomponent Na+:H+ antiporter subunit B [Sulfitobacter sp.]|jgi:multicomponent Na+:H+ antiporter subunit B